MVYATPVTLRSTEGLQTYPTVTVAPGREVHVPYTIPADYRVNKADIVVEQASPTATYYVEELGPHLSYKRQWASENDREKTHEGVFMGPDVPTSVGEVGLKFGWRRSHSARLKRRFSDEIATQDQAMLMLYASVDRVRFRSCLPLVLRLRVCLVRYDHVPTEALESDGVSPLPSPMMPPPQNPDYTPSTFSPAPSTATLLPTEVHRPIPNGYNSIVFGPREWRDYFGVEVGSYPSLPPDIGNLLNSFTPFFLKGELMKKRVGVNHTLTLIPATLNGKPFTLDRLGRLVQLKYFPQNNAKALGQRFQGYGYCSKYLTDTYRTQASHDTAYWLLLPKQPLAGTMGKSPLMQERTLTASPLIAITYRLPNALEVATALLTHYARSGTKPTRLYGSNQYVRCVDTVKHGRRLIVGGFDKEGLRIYDDKGESASYIGMVGVRSIGI